MEPQPRLGLAALTRIAFEGGDLKLLETELMSQFASGTASASTLMDLSVIAQISGRVADGLRWQAKALENCLVYLTHRPKKAPRTVLIFAAQSKMGANTPVEFLLPGGEFNIVTYYLGSESTSGEKNQELPQHDVAFCAMPADAEDAEAMFDRVRALTKDSDFKVLNLPENLIKPERDMLPELLADVAGLCVPKTLRIEREKIRNALKEEAEARTFREVGTYPFVCRPVGSHAGLGLEKIHSKQDFSDYLDRRDEQEFFVSEFVEYASEHDQRFRKFRVIVVNGKAFPCHMAISDQWDVWYMNAQMSESPSKRLEESAFMHSFAGGFGKRHAQAIEQLSEKLGLNYFGLDCSEDPHGNLVLFEVDNALIVHDMDCKTTFPYKEKHVRRVFSAFEKMLMDNSSTTDSHQDDSSETDESIVWQGRKACA